jgi:hypothetical protein
MVDLVLAAADLVGKAAADFRIEVDVEDGFLAQQRAEHEAGNHVRIQDGVVDARGRSLEGLDGNGGGVAGHRYIPSGHLVVSMRGLPVSRSVLRLARRWGHPCETASMSLDFVTPIS